MTIPEKIQRIYLVGLMGSGKSTTGKLLAEVLGWKFVDIDESVEEMAGMSIRAIFGAHGERYFRKLEGMVLNRSKYTNRVVYACGGGIILEFNNREFLKEEMVVWLDVSPAEAAGRIKSIETRPMLAPTDDVADVLHNQLLDRQGKYDFVSNMKIATGGESPEVVGSKILRKLEDGEFDA